MKVKVKEIVKYNGHSLSANGSVNFTLKAAYSELPNTIKLMQLLNNDVKIAAKVTGVDKPMKLGSFRIKQIIIDGDGESTIKFNGLNDYIEMDNLNMLPLRSDDNSDFNVQMVSDIEEEDENETEEDS